MKVFGSMSPTLTVKTREELVILQLMYSFFVIVLKDTDISKVEFSFPTLPLVKISSYLWDKKHTSYAINIWKNFDV